MARLTINHLNEGACSVLDEQGCHVGNLKLINAAWKFKAIGYDERGGVIPGGGPLTDRHNTLFTSLDLAEINTRLLNESP